MADENELREVSERIARLSRRELVRVLDMALDVEQRCWDEEVARQRAADAAFREAEKLRRERGVPVVPPEAKREAG